MYTFILGDYRIAFSDSGMKAYILKEKDFLSAFKVIAEKHNTVKVINKNENSEREIPKSSSNTTESDHSKQKKRKKSKKRPREDDERNL